MRSMVFTFYVKKICAGRNCKRIGTRILKVRFLNKTGIFCEVCAEEILTADLARVEDANEAVRIDQSRKEEHVNFG